MRCGWDLSGESDFSMTRIASSISRSAAKASGLQERQQACQHALVPEALDP